MSQREDPEVELHDDREAENRRQCVLVVARSRTLAEALSHAFEKAGHSALAATPADTFDVVASEQVSTAVVEADGSREAVIDRLGTLRERLGDVDVILFGGQSGQGTDELIGQLGARGSVSRDVDPTSFVKAVVASCTVSPRRPAARASLSATNPFATLTARQREVLAELLTGDSDAEIAGRLGVSAHTVRKHMQNVFLKLGVNTRFEAAAMALQAGVRPPQGTKR